MTSRRPVVAVVTSIAGLIKDLAERVANVEWWPIPCTPGTECPNAAEQLEGSEIVICDPHHVAGALHKIPQSVKWVQSTWAGVNIFIDLLQKPPHFQLTRMGKGMGPDMATYTIGQIIAKERQFDQYREDQRAKKWDSEGRLYGGYKRPEEISVGIMGIGEMGKHVAKACKALGMTVYGLVRNEVPSPHHKSPDVDHFMTVKSLADFLKSIDYICNTLPGTPETKYLLAGDVLSNCQAKKATFINIGRGDIIDEKSLLNALDMEWINHAVLDVFEHEPLPENSSLWSHPKVTITPHIAAVTRPELMTEVFQENLSLYIKDEELKYKVNWKEGY